MKVIPCIQYESKLNLDEMPTTKLEKLGNDNVHRKRSVPVFSAKYGVEGLFHVIDKFEKAAAKLQFLVADYWNEFDEVLDSTAENKWANLIAPIVPNQRTMARFNTILQEFVTHYSGSAEPRDVMKEYLESGECRKPRKVNPDDHAARIETLCKFANRLPGNEPEYTPSTIKKTVFHSFPEKWQQEYLKSGRSFVTDNHEQIVEYMNLLKGIADAEESKTKKKMDKKDKAERDVTSNGNRKKFQKKNNGGRGGRENSNRPDPDSTCPVHVNGNHKWKECSLNPRSSNYGNYSTRGNTGGRGGGSGRGSGGRGQGRGNNDNHYQERGNHNNVGQGNQYNGNSNGTPYDHYHSGPPVSGNGNWNNGPQGWAGSPSPSNNGSSRPRY